jgi:hypothetical protein
MRFLGLVSRTFSSMPLRARYVFAGLLVHAWIRV